MPTFGRFTRQAQHVLTAAQDEARAFDHPYVGTEHLLLGLTHDTNGTAGRVLKALGVTPTHSRRTIEFIVGRGGGPSDGSDLELTVSAKKVIEYAFEEARTLGQINAGTEHMLLGLARKGEGIAASVLEIMGINLDLLRATTLRTLGHPAAPDPPTPTASDPSTTIEFTHPHPRPRSFTGLAWLR